MGHVDRASTSSPTSSSRRSITDCVIVFGAAIIMSVVGAAVLGTSWQALRPRRSVAGANTWATRRDVRVRCRVKSRWRAKSSHEVRGGGIRTVARDGGATSPGARASRASAAPPGPTALTPSQLSALATLEELGPLRISALATLESVGRTSRDARRREPRGAGSPGANRRPRRQARLPRRTHGPRPRDVARRSGVERTVGLSSRMEALTPGERGELEAALPALEKIARDS